MAERDAPSVADHRCAHSCDCAHRSATAIAALGSALHALVSEPDLDPGERLTRLETALAGIGAFLRSVAA